MQVHFEKQIQIEAQSKAQSKAQVEALFSYKAPIEVLTEYSNYSNTFLAENIVKLLVNTRMNKHAIKLKEDKQLSLHLFIA